jgi:hypothetical protein
MPRNKAHTVLTWACTPPSTSIFPHTHHASIHCLCSNLLVSRISSRRETRGARSRDSSDRLCQIGACLLLPSLARSLSMSVILSASPSSMPSTYPNHPCSSVSKVLAFRLLSFLRLSLSPLPHHPHKHTKASDLTLVGSRKLGAQSTPGNAIWVRASSIVGPLLATSLESFFDLDPSTQPNFSPRS